MDTLQGFSEKHKLLEPMAGEWNAAVRIFSEDGQLISEVTGKMSSKMILGGRFLQQIFNGEVVSGQSFNGRGFFGYNEVAEIWQSSWIDNATTQMQTASGCYDPAKIEWQMKDSIIFADGKQVEKIAKIRIFNNNQHTMFVNLKEENQQPIKMMEINFRRAAS